MKQIQNISLNPCAALRVAAALFLALGMITTQAETPKEMFERILKEGVIGPQTGKTTEDGNFIMAVDSVKMDENIQPNQLLRAAARIAQRNVAGFLGEHITVDEELKKVSITNKTIDEMGIVKVDVKRTRESRSVIRTQIDQAMAAAGIFDSKVDEGRLYVGYILSEKQLLSVGLLKKTPNGGFAPVEPGENPPEDVSGVVATGLAMIVKNDVADARDRAMKSAQRSAVEQAFGVCVKATSQLRDLDPATLKDKQFTASFGALKSHVILSEGQEGTIYKIKIRAVVTRKIKLDVIVKAWQGNGASFFLNPGPDEDNPGADLLDVFGDFFKGLGFNITNNREAADYEIFLKSKHLNKIHPTSGRELTQLQLTVQIKDPRTGTLVLTQINDARRAVNDLPDKARRLQICAQKACRQLDKPLKAKVGKLVMDMLQNGRDIQVVFRGVENSNGAGYKFIEHQIEWMPGIRGGFNKAMYPKKREMVYKAKYSGPMDAIQTALTEALVARYDDDRPMMAQMGANHLVYQVAGGGAAAGAAHPPGGEGVVDQKAIANMVGMVVNGITLLNPANQLVEGPSLTFEIGVPEASALPREEFKAMCHIHYPNVDPKTKKIVSYDYGVGGSGSCFLITPDGYAITNQHVTEGVYYAQNHPVVINRLKRSAWPVKRGWKVNQAHFWVFLNGIAHNARVVHQSRKFDCSILKIDGISGAPFFKLSAKKKPDDLVVKTKVVTLGYPGSSIGPRTKTERELLNKKKYKIKDWFLESDLKFVLKEGVVAVVKDRLDRGLIIEHDATINGGNSGGPLVSSFGLENPTQDAVVYGINTWSINTGDNSYLSIMMETVREDIERHVPNAVWVDK